MTYGMVKQKQRKKNSSSATAAVLCAVHSAHAHNFFLHVSFVQDERTNEQTIKITTNILCNFYTWHGAPSRSVFWN